VSKLVGLKLDIQGHLLPATQGKSAYVTAIYKQPSLHTRALLDVFKGPTFTADAVSLPSLFCDFASLLTRNFLSSGYRP
jgi:hypothetical protein